MMYLFKFPISFCLMDKADLCCDEERRQIGNSTFRIRQEHVHRVICLTRSTWYRLSEITGCAGPGGVVDTPEVAVAHAAHARKPTRARSRYTRSGYKNDLLPIKFLKSSVNALLNLIIYRYKCARECQRETFSLKIVEKSVCSLVGDINARTE